MELKATEGMILTNGEAYGKSITLGKNDNESNWYEITEEEYRKIIEEQEKLQEQQKAEELIEGEV